MTAIAIDGPAGAGKSTVARSVAARLGFAYIDTGAMYRAVAAAALDREVPLTDGLALGRMLEEIEVEATDRRVTLDGKDVSARIRTPEITEAVSTVSAHPQVRGGLMEQQRRLARQGDVVMEGRDIGSQVLPEADLKIFLTASLKERALRRWRQDGSTGADLDEVERAIEARDQADSTRAASPLVKAADAVEVDTDGRTIDEVVGTIVALVGQRVGR